MSYLVFLVIGWMLFLFGVGQIPFWAIYAIVKSPKETLVEVRLR